MIDEDNPLRAILALLIIGIIIISIYKAEHWEIKYTKKADVLDIRRDDDALIHINLRIKETGEIIQFHDMYSCEIVIFEKNIDKPYAFVPYVHSRTRIGHERLEYGWNVSSHSGRSRLVVCLPINYYISFFID